MSPEEVALMVDDLYPVVGVMAYGSVLKVVRENRHMARGPVQRGTKAGLVELSKRSRDYLVFVVNATPIKFGSMMVLTYGKNYPRCGREVKRHLNIMLNWIRRRLGGEYLWFLEFQGRGAPHIHVLLVFKQLGEAIRCEFAEKWASTVCGDCDFVYSRLVGQDEWSIRRDMVSVHRHKKQWSKAEHELGLVGYVAKYATKPEQKMVPSDFRNVGRFFGWSKRVRDEIPEGDFCPMSGSELRYALSDLEHRVSDYHIVPKYIFGVGLKE